MRHQKVAVLSFHFIRHEQAQTLEEKREGRRENTVKLTDEVVHQIVNLIEEHPDFTRKQVKDHLEVPISVTSISRALDGRLISTMKKLEDSPVRRNSLAVKEARSEYAEWYMKHEIN